MDHSKLGESGIKANLESYIQSFSKDAREIFEYFNFAEFIGQLNDADLLYKVVQKVRKFESKYIYLALNCPLVTWKTNRTMSAKAPSAYMHERMCVGEDEISRRLKSHLIIKNDLTL